MRSPDREEQRTIQGLPVNVEIWIDPTEFPWGGDHELREDAEGYDVYVRVTLRAGDLRFTAEDSLSGCWVYPDDDGRTYIREVTEECTVNALSSLTAVWRAVRESRQPSVAPKQQPSSKR